MSDPTSPAVRDGSSWDDHPTAEPATERANSTSRQPQRWLLLRYGFYAATAAVVAWAALVVPLPYIEYVPGTPTPIPPLVEIDGIETTELDGETALLTILLRQQPTVPAIGALLDDRRALIHVDEVYRPGLGREDHLSAEREVFGRQFDVAAVVGARAAGIEADLVTEVVVMEVGLGSPADGLLERGDVVLAADGEPVIAAEELQALTRTAEAGDVVTLTVRRGDEQLDVAVELAEYGDDGQVRLGIGIETAVMDVRLPFEVSLAEGTRIGGPSAGMMVAVTVYDLLAEEDLLAGRLVMGTGSVDADGRIGQIGGIEEKMVAAAEAGADVVLVPSLQYEAARGAAPDDLEVVGVSDVDQALDALRDPPGDRP